jgi:hypothetical protein
MAFLFEREYSAEIMHCAFFSEVPVYLLSMVTMELHYIKLYLIQVQTGRRLNFEGGRLSSHP